MKLIYQMLLAVFLGIIFGNYLDVKLISTMLPFGDIYINLLKTIALPLIFFSLISGMTSLSDQHTLYKIGFKSIGLFLITGIIAAIIGISISALFSYHQNITRPETALHSSSTSLSLKSFLGYLIPNNFFGAFTGDSTIQVTLLALLIAITILTLPRKEKKIARMFVKSANKLFLNMVTKIILLIPITIFIFAAHLTASFEKKIFLLLINFVSALMIAYLIQYLLLGIYIRLFSKLPCLPFFIKSIGYQAIAMSTGSSKATLPYSIQIAHEKLGISQEKATFVLPLGATINMDGLAIYLSMSVLFIANNVGIVFSFEDYLLLALVSSLMAIGTAGIPGGALAVLPILFSIWHLPYEFIPLFIAIDPLINLFRSTLNITGDVAVTLILDRLHGGLEIETYKTLESPWKK